MVEYIEKHKAVNLLTALENEFQQFSRSKVLNTQCIVNCAKRKSLSGNYLLPTLRWLSALTGLSKTECKFVPNVVKNIHGMISVLRIVIAVARKWRCNTCGLCVHGAEK